LAARGDADPPLRLDDIAQGVTARRVALVGPVLPFRGGIAQHTTFLRRALSQETRLLTISFTRQYPSLIFPGRNDRDSALDGYQEQEVHYLLDSLNPLTWRDTVRRILEFGADTVVLPWWTVYWTLCFGYIARSLRQRGVQVLFLCHNSLDHEAASWKARLTRLALSQGDGFIVHTAQDRLRLAHSFPEAPVKVSPHPIYQQFPRASPVPPKRGRLDLLFFGFVRPYKGLNLLIEALAKTDDGVFLTIAGEFWGGLDETVALIQGHGLTLNP
jgi:glycosyltransferase involved in cell wall biosynthesis